MKKKRTGTRADAVQAEDRAEAPEPVITGESTMRADAPEVPRAAEAGEADDAVVTEETAMSGGAPNGPRAADPDSADEAVITDSAAVQGDAPASAGDAEPPSHVIATAYAVAPGSSVAGLSAEDRGRLLDRGRSGDPGVAGSVMRTIADVRARGDAALVEQAARFDGVAALRIEVPLAECRAALDALDAEIRAALEEAARNIAVFHEAQRPETVEVEVRPGVRVGRRPDPLNRVAVYAPGGRAAYPSSVLMGAVPARVAGVREVIVCSPPGPDGSPPAAVLAACALAGVDRVFAIGGAGAVAAAAYGTETVPAVDRIVGPGNAYVTEAKRQVSGAVSIDMPAGPSEVLVLADDSADPERVAMELLAQAEHDPDAASVLVTTSEALLDAVARAVDREVASQPRREIVEASFAARGALLLAADLAEMLEFSGVYAPEHLALYLRDARAALGRVRNAGAVFLGDATSVAFGDYLTGGNHVLPTGGLARGSSGLGTLDFVRWTSYQEVDDAGAARMAGSTATLAEVEGLPAHAGAARLRGRRHSEPFGDAQGKLCEESVVSGTGATSRCHSERSEESAVSGPGPTNRCHSEPREESVVRGLGTGGPPASAPRTADPSVAPLSQDDEGGRVAPLPQDDGGGTVAARGARGASGGRPGGGAAS